MYCNKLQVYLKYLLSRNRVIDMLLGQVMLQSLIFMFFIVCIFESVDLYHVVVIVIIIILQIYVCFLLLLLLLLFMTNFNQYVDVFTCHGCSERVNILNCRLSGCMHQF